MAITITKRPCPDTTLQVNGVTEGTHVAGSTIGINLSDGVNPVTPDSVTKVGDNYAVVLPACPPAVSRSTATLMKTGQTTSYRTGDDGDIQAGRDDSFFILAEDNPFGHRQRFTGITGGYYDQTLAGYYDKDGVATTEALAFPDDITMDWSAFNGSTCLGYGRFGSQVDINWNDAIDEALAKSVGSYTSGWRMCNYNEVVNVAIKSGTGSINDFNYTAINWYDLGGGVRFWCSTSNGSSFAYEWDRRYPLNYVTAKTTSSIRRYVWCRTFTVTGTTLT